MAWGTSLWGTDPWEGSAPNPSSTDFYFDCLRINFDTGVERPGLIYVILTIDPPISHIHEATTIELTTSLDGDLLGSYYQDTDTEITVTTSIATLEGDVYISTASLTGGWVWTSKIGVFDFSLDDGGGEASRRPMPFTGLIQQIRKLGNSAVVYGSQGVATMTPQELIWGIRHIHDIGILGKGAATGTDDLHYFIDRYGMLYRLKAESLPEKLDYTHLMSSLNSNTIMSYDVRRDIVYIADGTLGYALTKDGLGECPANITGVGWRDGTFHVLASSAITNSPFEITTDTIDFGVRTEKTIDYIECNIDLANDLYVKIEYRWSKDDSWTSTEWRRVDDYGRVSFLVTATEFRIHAKLTTYEDIRLDDIRVHGRYPDAKPIEGLVGVE